MRYVSTRGLTPALGFSDAVATGLAPDGGLFLPETLPEFTRRDLEAWARLSYPELCHAFLRTFATDIPEETLRTLITRSYATFSHPEIAPLKHLSDDLFVLELFHGPTLAFKDFALQLLGNLYEYQCRERGESINVLGATSGDTGSAAIHGLLGKPGTAIFILYPEGRTSPLQERQMACTGASNVHAIAIQGTFDDAQAIVKELLGDQTFRKRHRLSAVNSINLARVLAQCVYYLYAWLHLPPRAQAEAEFVVPTGNFGNVLAGWMLQKMGVPLRSFRVATNQNDILYRLFNTGEYKPDAVRPSHAPSMDIQVASNFERFLYYHNEKNAKATMAQMEQFKKDGSIKIANFNASNFAATRSTDEDILKNIRMVKEKYDYVIDPHTACGFQDLDPSRTHVVLATAHPAKFPAVINEAIGETPTDPSLEAIKKKKMVTYPVEATAEAVRTFLEENGL